MPKLAAERALARQRLIDHLYDCKAQSDRLYAQTRLLARFASPFRFDLSDRVMHLFGHPQRRIKLSRSDNGESIAFTFHDDDTLDIIVTGSGKAQSQPRGVIELGRALMALDQYLERALASPENLARLRGDRLSVVAR